MIDGEKEMEVEQEITDSKTMELIDLMTDLSMDYEENINNIMYKINKTKSLLDELKSKISDIEHIKENTANLFSPNMKIEDSDELDREVKKNNEYLEELTKKKNRLVKILEQMDETIGYIQKKGQQQTDVSINVLNSNEYDRQRIARDLHDTTVQNLTGMVHKIELCTRLVDLDPVRAKLELSIMSNTVKNTINETRDIIYNLRPMTLEDLGLTATIERYINQIKLNNDIKISYKYNQENTDIQSVVNLALYRVVQEACHNVIKHANATKIDININYTEKNIIISIKDNGKGFDVEKRRDAVCQFKSGYGLPIMKERINLLSGTLDVQSENKKGTIITISVPLMKRKGDKNEQTD